MNQICQRCEKEFIPKERLIKGKPFIPKCCDKCRYNNLIDGLGLPSHPSLLDKHTVNPALTNHEYNKKMRALVREKHDRNEENELLKKRREVWKKFEKLSGSDQFGVSIALVSFIYGYAETLTDRTATQFFNELEKCMDEITKPRK